MTQDEKDLSPKPPSVDARAHPETYRIGRGEQGVLTVEPYKSELLPLWAFRTPAVARDSAAALYGRYSAYREEGDFVGMDMARKFLQMGYTRSRRYANHAGGRKYGRDGVELPRAAEPDEEKVASASIFYEAWRRVTADPVYQERKKLHQREVERWRPRANVSRPFMTEP